MTDPDDIANGYRKPEKGGGGMNKKIKMDGVTEYNEEMDVELAITKGKWGGGKPEKDWDGRGRIVIKAYNEGGYNSVEIDLVDLMNWINKNKAKIEELNK